MSRRTARVGEAIREVVSTAILFDVKDPRVHGVTVLGCDVSGDLKNARVRVSIMGDDAARKLCLHGLNSSTGFLQRRIAERLQLRYTPILKIVEDDSVKRSIEMSRLIREHGAESGESEHEEVELNEWDTSKDPPSDSTPRGTDRTEPPQ